MDNTNNGRNQSQTNQGQKTSMTDKVGDAVEKIGHKISDLGMPGLGQKIHDLGDKVEKTHDDPTHPHDV